MRNKLDLPFLEEMCKIPSLSGNEQEVQKLIYTRMKKYADKVETDILGNVYAIKNPDAKYRVMIVGHCDEVGFRVNYIDDSGFIYISADYGADFRIAPGKRVFIETVAGRVVGVIGRKARALEKVEERKSAVEITNIWVDIGCSTKAEARKLVKIGDPVIYGSNLGYLKNDLVSSRALDDKIGVFVAMEAFRLLVDTKLDVGLYCVSSVQEEAGRRGATTATFKVRPDCGIAIDVTDASDIPGIDPRETGKKKLGDGPVLVRGPNINEMLVSMLHDVSHEHKIPTQLIGRPRLTGTDARVVQVSREGVATALISIPLRYMHLPSEVVSLSDVANTIHLIQAFMKGLPPNPDFRPLAQVMDI